MDRKNPATSTDWTTWNDVGSCCFFHCMSALLSLYISITTTIKKVVHIFQCLGRVRFILSKNLSFARPLPVHYFLSIKLNLESTLNRTPMYFIPLLLLCSNFFFIRFPNSTDPTSYSLFVLAQLLYA